MGCVQSAPGKPLWSKHFFSKSPKQPTAAEILAAQQAEAAAKAKAAINAASQSDDNKPRDTAVLRQAGQFDQLHEEALKMPSLKDIRVVRGANSMRLLEGFEQKEAEARAMPELVNIDEVDVKESRLYDKLREFELKEEKARAEPRLEKTFMQKQRESFRASSEKSLP